MNRSRMYIAIAAVAVVVVCGGVYAVSAKQSADRQAATMAAEKMAEDKAMKAKEAEAMQAKDAMAKDGDAMMQKDATPTPDAMMKADENKPGAYVPFTEQSLAATSGGKAVIFFAASWCPTCKALNQDITANLSNIPHGVTILKADYDTVTSLKQKYGVTTQHTLVQVDAKGNQIKKWTGSPTLLALASQVN